MEADQPANSAPNRAPVKARIEPLDWALACGAVEPVERAVEAFVLRRRRRRIFATGAAMAMLVLAGVVWQTGLVSPKGTAASPKFVVSAPERRVLNDGSVVELANGAEIAVDFTPGIRRVSLLRGEAMFEVAKNPARPFVVAAGKVEIRAVGTAFCVNLKGSEVGVLVTEGRVSVRNTAVNGERADTPGVRPLAVVDAGRRVVVDFALAASTHPMVQAVPAPEIADLLAWRVPRLEFDSTPLTDVIAAVNRQGSIKITLANPKLGRLPLSGVLRADNIGVLIQILDTSYHIKAEHRGENEIVLR